MLNRKQAAAIVGDLQVQLRSAEQSIDAALVQLCELTTVGLLASKELNLHTVHTEPALKRSAEAYRLLTEARTALVGAHDEAEAIARDRLNMALSTGKGVMAPHPTNASAEASRTSVEG